MSQYRATAMPMRVQVRPGSAAERGYLRSARRSPAWPRTRSIAAGIDPDPLEDLVFHGGKVVPQMEFQNVYLGGAESWTARDVDFIDSAIQRAMRHPRLNNVLTPYFPGARPSCDMRPSFVVDEARPKRLDESDVQAQIVALYDAGLLKKTQLDTCIFNLVLPAGTVLTLGRDSSMHGLGGYHGSRHVRRAGRRVTLYYSANVYSQRLADGRENGIVAFGQPWKDVVATLYHELNEFRTDADVKDAIDHDDDDFLGWMSRSGMEIGDQPIIRAGNARDLRLVFKEVPDPPRKRRLPVQFMYSNVAHGPEGPIPRPHS
jgi:hypothetical protein